MRHKMHRHSRKRKLFFESAADNVASTDEGDRVDPPSLHRKKQNLIIPE